MVVPRAYGGGSRDLWAIRGRSAKFSSAPERLVDQSSSSEATVSEEAF